MIALALLQAAVTGPVLPRERVRVTAATCREQAVEAKGDDIVVCATPQEQFRLKKLPARYSDDRSAVPKAEMSILGGKAKVAAEGEQGSIGPIPSNRAMIRLKVPF